MGTNRVQKKLGLLGGVLTIYGCLDEAPHIGPQAVKTIPNIIRLFVVFVLYQPKLYDWLSSCLLRKKEKSSASRLCARLTLS